MTRIKTINEEIVKVSRQRNDLIIRQREIVAHQVGWCNRSNEYITARDYYLEGCALCACRPEDPRELMDLRYRIDRLRKNLAFLQRERSGALQAHFDVKGSVSE